jgi:hypothetical protein
MSAVVCAPKLVVGSESMPPMSCILITQRPPNKHMQAPRGSSGGPIRIEVVGSMRARRVMGSIIGG